MNTQDGGDILLQAEKISSLIATARHLMADGKSVDLSHLEGKIRTLCEDAQSTDLKQPEVVGAALKAIVEDLNRLGEEINTRHSDAGGTSLEDSIKRAINAYHTDSEES
ncbi:MAG: hypothetical protein HQ513_03025 [Rhodospirillales bacterium]|nr:hypothetical protein [Rhodospirillales bacterium]